MRAFILALALTFTFGLTACADSATEEAYEEGAPAGDEADVIGDGEVFDEPGEPDADVLGDGLDDTMNEIEADASDMADDVDAELDGDMDGDGM
ncbi:hypothetical protein [Rubrivirga sp. IMCC43871]|uniref:hypothetical protein n=1 Tax=Rubrivirga sp. IMCC43871 TaxID=3391575 RepID=UPI00398FC163